MNNWNNGNGQGNGYGQQPQGASGIYDGLTAQTIQDQGRDPFIDEGQHVLAVVSISEFASQNLGPCVRAVFEVLESNKHPVGSTVSSMWAMLKPAPKPGMTRDQDRFVDFITRLQGAPAGHPIGQDIKTLLKDRPQDQLARGTIIRANGVRKFAKQLTEKNKDGFVVVFWDHVAQAPAEIAQMRAKIDARLASSGGAGPQTGGPAQLGYGQPQGQPQGYAVDRSGPQGQPPQTQYVQPQQPQTQAWGQPAPAQPAPAQPAGPAPSGWGGNNGGNRGW